MCTPNSASRAAWPTWLTACTVLFAVTAAAQARERVATRQQTHPVGESPSSNQAADFVAAAGQVGLPPARRTALGTYICNADMLSPPNDCCDPQSAPGQTGPIVVTTFPTTLAFNNTMAETDGVDDGSNPCNSAGPDDVNHRDLWYLVQAPIDGTLAISTCQSSDHDTKIAAYNITGPMPGIDYFCALLPTALSGCNEDCLEDALFFSSDLRVEMSAGEWKLVRLGTFSPDASEDNAESGSGEIYFEFENACISETTAAGCEAADGRNPYGVQTYFQYTATATGALRVDSCLAPMFPDDCRFLPGRCTFGFFIFDGCCPIGEDCEPPLLDDGTATLTELCVSENISIDAIADNCYTIAVFPHALLVIDDAALTITPDCDPEPAGLIIEGERCGGDANGGCNAGGGPQVFTNIDNAHDELVTVQGVSFAHEDLRDTDWFDLVLIDPDGDGLSKICYRIKSSMPLGVGIVRPIDDCAALEGVEGVVASEACNPEISLGEFVIDAFTDGAEGPGQNVGLWVGPFDPFYRQGIFDFFPWDGLMDTRYSFCVAVVDVEDDCAEVATVDACFTHCGSPGCRSDLDGDGTVNAADLAELLSAWGSPGCGGGSSCCPDMDGSGAVNAADLAFLLAAWGNCMAPEQDCNSNLTDDALELAIPTAIELPTPSDRLELPNVSDFPSTTITVEMWLRATGDADAIFSYSVSGTDNEFLLFNAHSLDVYIDGNPPLSTGVNIDGDGTFNWHHLAVTWDSDTGAVKVYVDAVEQQFPGTHQQGAELIDGGCLILGEEQDSLCGGFDANQKFVGQYREVRLWNDVRTPLEILANYDNVLTGTEPGLVSYWPMDDGACSSTASDQAGNNSLELIGEGVHWVGVDNNANGIIDECEP